MTKSFISHFHFLILKNGTKVHNYFGLAYSFWKKL